MGSDNIQHMFNSVTLDTLKQIVFPQDGVKFHGTYRGIITKCSTDSKKALYVKVKIFGLTEEIPLKHQPWARSSGANPIPEAGTYVDIVFENGDIHFPVWSNPSKSKNGKLVTKSQKQSKQKNQVIYDSQEGTSVEYDKKTGDFIISHSMGTVLKINSLGMVELIAGPGGIPIPTARVITEMSICPFTMGPHTMGSAHLKVPGLSF